MKKNLSRLLPAILLLSLPAAALAETSVHSTSILRLQQTEQAGFGTKTQAPLTEFLGLDADKLGDGNLSAHLFGWAQLGLGDRNDPNSDTDGSLSYGFLKYRFKYANAQARAGRLFVTEGIINEQVDGVSARTDLPYGFGVSAFGGATVHTKNIPLAGNDGKGDGIFGGRVNYRYKGSLEVGLSGVYESKAPTPATPLPLAGSFGDHRLVGADFWLSPHAAVQFSGRSSYNTETEGFAEQSYLLQLRPYKSLALTASYDEHHDRDYFYSSILFASLLHDLGQDSKAYGVSASYDLNKQAAVSADFKEYRRDIGKAQRFGADLRLNLSNAVRTGLGYHYLRSSSDFAVLQTPSASGSFHEVRGYAMRDSKSYFAALDVIGYIFKDKIDNGGSAWEGIGSLGYHFSPALALSGDLSYGRNPRYDQEVKGLLRLTYDMNYGKGGSK